MSPEFQRAVVAVVAAIPPGRVASYGQLAALAGWPRHARHVGRLLGHLPDGVSLPWWRVVGGDGRLSRPGSPEADYQRLLLEEEGVELDRGGRVAMRRWQWDGNTSA